MKNIVFITADQLGAAFVGCYGSGVNSTPTLDSLARKGIRFERCYAAHPVCAPNRSIMLTGRCDEMSGVTANNLCLTGDIPTIAHVLSQAGFRPGASCAQAEGALPDYVRVPSPGRAGTDRMDYRQSPGFH